MTNAQFGFLFSAVAFGSVVFQAFSGVGCDRFGVRKVMTSGLLIVGASVSCFSFSRSFLLSSMLLLITGLGMGWSQVAGTKGVIDWFPPKGRGTAMGLKQTGLSSGGILASVLLPILLITHLWRSSLGVIGLISFGFGLLFFLLYRDSETKEFHVDQRMHLRDALKLLRRMDFMIIILVGILFMAAQASFSTYLVLYLNQKLHHSMELSGSFLALAFATGALGRVAWGVAGDYLFGSRKAVLVAIGGLGAAVGIMLSLTHPASSRWLIYSLAISFGLTGMGWTAVWLTLIGEILNKETMGLGIGIAYCVSNLAILAAPPLFGLLIDLFNSYACSWIFLSSCLGVGAFLMLFF